MSKGDIKIIEKIKSQTYQKITKQQQQDIKDILNQPNATFKNNKGEDKKRHDGLTIKFSNKTNKKPLSSEINDNLSENEVFHYAENNIYVEEKRTNNFPKYTYNSVRTCLGSF